MGANKANPAAMILSATMLLRHLGLESQANVIASSVYDVIKEGKIRTADMGGKSLCPNERGLWLMNRKHIDYRLHQGCPQQVHGLDWIFHRIYTFGIGTNDVMNIYLGDTSHDH
jgi:hypothetical protein